MQDENRWSRRRVAVEVDRCTILRRDEVLLSALAVRGCRRCVGLVTGGKQDEDHDASRVFRVQRLSMRSAFGLESSPM